METLGVRNVNEEVELPQCQVGLLNHIFGYILPFALKSIVELGIPDIIHSHGQPMNLSQIVSKIDSLSPDITSLFRIMRFLVQKKIFTTHKDELSGEILYELTPTCQLLLHDHEKTLAPWLLTVTHPWMMAPWHQISQSIKEGETLTKKAHGKTFWEIGKVDPLFNDLFNSALFNGTKMMMNAILDGYKDGFSRIKGTLIDVGGGMGQAVAEIVRAHPDITGVNFDLPHVVANAPKHLGVTHIGGDMFENIPSTDAVFIKSVLHDWKDQDCLKILKNCHKAVSEKKGKVIIADILIDASGNDYFHDMKLQCDLLMMANSDGGKERTENEFRKLLDEAGFAYYNIITFPFYVSVIEAYPH